MRAEHVSHNQIVVVDESGKRWIKLELTHGEMSDRWTEKGTPAEAFVELGIAVDELINPEKYQ